MKRGDENGFTLVETVAAAMLMSILALGAFSLFMMYSESARENGALLMMQRQREAFMEELGRKTRSANIILPLGGDCDSYAAADEDSVTVTGVVLCGPDPETGDSGQTGGFRFEGGIVEEWDKDDGWRPFTAGSTLFLCGDAETLLPHTHDNGGVAVEHDGNGIFLESDRAQMSVTMTLKRVSGKDTFYLSGERFFFQCRTPINP